MRNTVFDQEDFDLSVAQLREKYDSDEGWGSHPKFTMEDWQFEVSEGDTRRGYWEWVSVQLEMMWDEGREEAPAIYKTELERTIKEDREEEEDARRHAEVTRQVRNDAINFLASHGEEWLADKVAEVWEIRE